MSDELKPCAHCGADAELMCPSGLSWWVQCSNKACGMGTKIAYSDEPVISAWNNRAAPVPQPQEARDVPQCISQHDHRAMQDDAPISFARGWNNCIAAILAAKEKK